MIYALLFGSLASLGLGVAVALSMGGWSVSALLIGWFAVSFGLASLAYGGLGPRTFGKRPDGSVPWWSLALSGPFLVVGRAGLRAFNATGLETPWSEVDANVWLGRRPQGPDGTAFAGLAPRAVVDMTAEVAKSRHLQGHEAYLVLPTLDNESPSPAQLERGLVFIETHRIHGPVYVHCALGNGRAATMMAAWMLGTGRVETPTDAVRMLQERRPSVGLSQAQQRGLMQWHEGRRSACVIEDS